MTQPIQEPPGKTRKDSLTPLMQQYHDLKSRYPQELLFFRLGDFYELFDEDARRAAPILEVALTHRQEVPMCGVPAHAVDPYIAKLLKAGLRVAIADQMEDPATAKGLVKRDIVRVVTPGTLREDSLLAVKKSNFLMGLLIQNGRVGLAALECSTGEFIATETEAEPSSVWKDEITRLSPSEIVLPTASSVKEIFAKEGISLAEVSSVDFSPVLAEERLKRAFDAASLRGFGVEGKPLALAAAGALIRYLENTQCGRSFTLRPLRYYSLDDFLLMDAHTLEHLELQEGPVTTASAKTLLGVIDQTLTPMGGRLIRRWLVAPLKQVPAIRDRQSKVQFFVENKESRRHLRAVLQGWPDTERIMARLQSRSCSPRDLSNLGQGLRRVPKLKLHLNSAESQLTALDAPCPAPVAELIQSFPEDSTLATLLERALVDAPPNSLKEGGVIRPAFNAELDEIRSWILEGKNRLIELEKREREQTGIGSLKIGFNNIFGYYIEVTRTHLSRVPAHYIRKQTTVNAERFITPELKDFETKILGAEERAVRLEAALFDQLREQVLAKSTAMQALAQAIAELDVFLSLADLAERRNYCKPTVDESDALVIREGRHPVLEDVLRPGTLVPNDIELNGSQRQILILTGPNMSGKSTYLRQTALIVILAQIGSYVPAAEAHVGVVDHLFTRIGASDRLAEGESTFMVEMVETAHILNHATPRSLIILDEVGRGTSTYDGISIAWACIEYLHSMSAVNRAPCTEEDPNGPRITVHGPQGPKVMFATHYFELTELAERLPGVQNAHVTAREWGDHVVFLHKVESGPADRAYGIHVARLAGVPKPVLERAKVLLAALEQTGRNPLSPLPAQTLPLEESSEPSRIMQESALWKEALRKINVNDLSPIEALLKLDELKKRFLTEDQGGTSA